jgi:predicted Na+-dependent transporter
MDLKELLSSFAQITVFTMMLSMGMVLGFAGMGHLWRRPSLLGRCILAAFVVVPLAAMVVTKVLPLPFEVRAGIAAMAVIPSAPVIYRKMLLAAGLLAGHYLSGPDPVEQQTLAIANGSRHAGGALTPIPLNFPTVAQEVLVTIASYALMSAIAAKIYQKLLARRTLSQDTSGG